ncbi:MAG TPA: hypothetical protein VER33_28510 [Polyangiaceae bacterium]|nr:hypothetical protein [Polyangiaceae bacterium]
MGGGAPRSRIAAAFFKAASPLRGWLLLSVLAAPPVVVELVLAIPATPLIYIAYGAVAGFIQLSLLPSDSQRLRLLQVAALAATLVVLHLVPWTSRKVFLAAYNRIEPGMTIEAAHSLVAPHSIEPHLQTGETVRGYKHSRAARFDSDIGLVHFSNGRVTRTEFLPD